MRDHCARRRSLRLPMPFDRRRDSQCSPLARAGRAWRFPLLLLTLWSGPQANAQTSASLTLVSEYGARGISLSAGHPALQLRVDHDAAGGWYLGGFASPVTLGESGRQGELVAYGGRAGRLDAGLSWDLGVKRTVFLRDRHYDYHEFYAGLSSERLGARLFLSPAYYGQEASAYLDLNGARPLDERFTLTAHAGLLHTFGGRGPDARDRADIGIALAATFGDCTVQLGWQTLLRAADGELPRARALSASASIRF